MQVGIGIATGCDSVFITEDPGLVEKERLLLLFFMRDHRRGHTVRRYLVNPWTANGDLVDLTKYPRLKGYFESHYDVLCKRAIARKNRALWYRTIDKPRSGLTEKELLLLPDMASNPDPVLSRGFYPHHNCYWMTSDTWDLCVLGGLLMSDAIRSFIDAMGVKMNGGTLRFQAQYLRMVHLPPYERISSTTRKGLRSAFLERNRDVASHFARLAYKEAMQ